jgi:CheY-like chemotaxis protein
MRKTYDAAPRPRVVAADDHEAVLDQVARELGDDIELVATVGDGPAAVEPQTGSVPT